MGYLPEALANFICLLSFTMPDGREIVTMKELIDVFDLLKVHKSGAVFDMKKLDWLNGEYIKKMGDKELADKLLAGGWLPEEMAKENVQKILPLARERMKKLSEISEFDYFFKEPEYDGGLLVWKNRSPEEIKNSLSEVAKIIEENGTEDKDALRQELDSLGVKLGDRGLAYWPLRVALSGLKASPDPVDIAEILGKEKTLGRVKKAIEKQG
jgi:glutamyl/glutaminyl-tRNA synthetase